MEQTPPEATYERSHPVGVIVGVLLGLALLFMIGMTLTRGNNQARGQSTGEALDLTTRTTLPVIQAKEGEHWTHAPIVPPPVHRTEQARLVVKWRATEFVGDLDVSNKVRYAYWGFEGSVPGPLLRAREGDLIEVHLTNDLGSTHPHNIDFHFATGPGGGASALSVAPGETAKVEIRALAPGIYMYHCATPDIPTHIANGMYGFVIIEPAEGLPQVERELYVVQSEFYATQGGDAPATLDAGRLDAEEPTHVVFNGAAGSLMGDNSPKVKVGDRVRIWFGNAGPQMISSFHVIGEIFDRVYREGDLVSPPARAVQTTLVPAGGATAVEFRIDVPGTYLLVDHAIARALHKGAVGAIVSEGDENQEIFAAGRPGSAASGPDGHGEVEPSPPSGSAVTITTGAWDQKNAPKAYDPAVIRIKSGTTVVWTNRYEVAHTVTADDSSFDSGFLNPGQSWSYIFAKPGTLTYHCTPHPWMKATIIVS